MLPDPLSFFSELNYPNIRHGSWRWLSDCPGPGEQQNKQDAEQWWAARDLRPVQAGQRGRLQHLEAWHDGLQGETFIVFFQFPSLCMFRVKPSGTPGTPRKGWVRTRPSRSTWTWPASWRRSTGSADRARNRSSLDNFYSFYYFYTSIKFDAFICTSY